MTMVVAPESATSADGSIVVEYRDSNHTYKITTPDIGKVVSVTGIVGAYDKPALPYAAANVTIEGVVQAFGDVSRMRDLANFLDTDALGRHLYDKNLRHYQVWGGKADRGTFVHGVNQAWIEDGRVPTEDDVPADYHPFIGAFGAFVIDHEPAFVRSEVIVASAKHRFAGRYDAVGTLGKRCDNKKCGCYGVLRNDSLIRFDWKTSTGIYAEMFNQLDLYEVGAREFGEAPVDHSAIVRLGASGKYEFVLSKVPVGSSLGLVAGYRSKIRAEELHPAPAKPKGRRK